jgi:hypothetical protein
LRESSRYSLPFTSNSLQQHHHEVKRSRDETESDGSDLIPVAQRMAVVIAEGTTSIEADAFYESTTLVYFDPS